jgi:hypothetical protein
MIEIHGVKIIAFMVSISAPIAISGKEHFSVVTETLPKVPVFHGSIQSPNLKPET